VQNLEQKFQCANLGAAALAATNLGAVDRGVMRQRDQFFTTPYARLKLRTYPDDAARPAELIAYHRSNIPEARPSEYFIAPVAEPEKLAQTLAFALGKPSELRKTRRLMLFRSTRIHLDTVESLGTFVELETVITTQSLAEARQELLAVVRALDLADPISTAYIDLLP
jgi:adenylate cyclase class IV